MVGESSRKLWRRLWFRALIASAFLRLVPYVRMVGLNGSMATGNFHEGSDIDFYTVTKPGHIYLCRFLSLCMVQVLGLRRHGDLVAGRVCMNRFATSDFLQITPNDHYHAHVFHNTFPLFAAPRTYEAFCRENQWMVERGFPLVVNQVVLRHSVLTYVVQRGIEVLLSPIAGFLERALEARQVRRYSRDPRVTVGSNTIVLTNQELRFHLDKTVHGPA